MPDLASEANVSSIIQGVFAPSVFFVALTGVCIALFVYFHNIKRSGLSKLFLAGSISTALFAFLFLYLTPRYILSFAQPQDSPSIPQQKISALPNIPFIPQYPPAPLHTYTPVPLVSFSKSTPINVTAPDAGSDQTHYSDAQAANYLGSLLSADGFNVVSSEDTPVKIEVLAVPPHTTSPGDVCSNGATEMLGMTTLQIAILGSNGKNIPPQINFLGHSKSCEEEPAAREVEAVDNAWMDADLNAEKGIIRFLMSP